MSIARRDFIKAVGVTGVAGLAVGRTTDPVTAAIQAVPKQDHGAHPTRKGAAAPAPNEAVVYTFLNADEAAFVEAAVDTLLPADDLTPGGTELGIALFIDRQLGGSFGQGGRMYRQGPFAPGLPEQGWQLPLTPADAYRMAVPAINRLCQDRLGRDFKDLDEAGRSTVLSDLEHGRIELPDVPGRVFFELLYQNAIEGFFADPAYGGNRGKAAWRMIGYPGVSTVYADVIEEYHNKPYPHVPQGIADQI
jgi:gluconate 2-dehydrogenase gamma chain